MKSKHARRTRGGGLRKVCTMTAVNAANTRPYAIASVVLMNSGEYTAYSVLGRLELTVGDDHPRFIRHARVVERLVRRDRLP